MRDSISSHQFVEDDEVKENGVRKDDEHYRDSYSWFDPEEGDYARVLEIINEFLPVKEMAGRLIGVSVLRQFDSLKTRKRTISWPPYSRNVQSCRKLVNAMKKRRVQRCEKVRARQMRK